MILRKVFLAGTIQGANRGITVEDQTYRRNVSQIVNDVFPGCECFDPSKPVKAAISDPFVAGTILQMVQNPPDSIDTRQLPPSIASLREAFHEMTRVAGKSDLCIAYIPGRTPSMGTAMEMYAAYIAGVPVVAVTEMIENLSIISTATWVMRDLNQLREWLVEQATVKDLNLLL